MRIIQTQQDMDSLHVSPLHLTFLERVQKYSTQLRNSFHNQKQFLPACLEEPDVLQPEQAFFVRVILRTTNQSGANR
ncbi:hypothetical protein ACWHAM_24915 [Paenibacillus terrae]